MTSLPSVAPRSFNLPEGDGSLLSPDTAPLGTGTAVEALRAQTQPPGLVDKPLEGVCFAIVTPPLQGHLRALTTKRGLAFEARNAEHALLGANRSLTKAPAGRAAPKGTRSIKNVPRTTRAKRTLALKMPTLPAPKPSSTVPPPPKRICSPKDWAAASGKGKKAVGVSAVPIPSKQTVVTVSDLRRVIAEGIPPVSTQIATLSKQMGEVYDTVSRITISLHTQGVGNERTAHAVARLQGAVQGVCDGVVTRIKTEAAPYKSFLKST